MNKGFNLASVLDGIKDAAPAEGRETLEYISIDLLDDDPNNFYRLSGIEELAASIELLGLQQPIRVRTSPEEAARCIIVSGHRRAAALRLLRDEGKTAFAEAPCIRETAESSAALQELRLIYANSDTRKISDAELAKQAERVEALLYELKEQGLEFPGRMRDHVAEACKVSKSKLSRLKVIREGLIPEIAEVFSENRMSEIVAYSIAQQPPGIQKALLHNYGGPAGLADMSESEAAHRVEYVKRPPSESKIDFNTPNKAIGAAKTETGFDAEAYGKQLRDDDITFMRILGKWFYTRIYAKEAGDALTRMEGINAIKQSFRYSCGRGSDVEYDASNKGLTLWGRGGFDRVSRTWTEVWDLLALFALREYGQKKDNRCENAAPLKWRTGTPEKGGSYVAKFELDGMKLKKLCYFDGILKKWRFSENSTSVEAECVGWFPLPEDEEEPRAGKPGPYEDEEEDDDDRAN